MKYRKEQGCGNYKGTLLKRIIKLLIKDVAV